EHLVTPARRADDRMRGVKEGFARKALSSGRMSGPHQYVVVIGEKHLGFRAACTEFREPTHGEVDATGRQRIADRLERQRFRLQTQTGRRLVQVLEQEWEKIRLSHVRHVEAKGPIAR